VTIPSNIAQVSIDEVQFDAINRDEIISDFVSKKLLPLLPSEAKIITLDGFDGVGKSTISRLMSHMLGIPHINLDDYLVKARGCFVDAVKKTDLKEAMEQSLIQERRVVVEGCMVDDVLETIDMESQFRIYVMRTARMYSNADDERVREEVLYGDESTSYFIASHEETVRGAAQSSDRGGTGERGCLRKELILYHRKKRPQDRANLIIKVVD